ANDLRKIPTGWLVQAPAKLNLYLDVLGRRADGYHELETLMAPVSLWDTLHLAARDDGQICLTCKKSSPAGVDDFSKDPLPTDDRNLVVRALKRLQDELRTDQGADVTLWKRIPSRAGLGGGSSDAAAALQAGLQLWEASLPPGRLKRIAEDLGSDVPFFLTRRSAVCRGRGEQIEPAATPAGLTCVLAQPPVGLGAGEVFGQLTPDERSRSEGCPLHELLNALRAGRLSEAGRMMRNRLQQPAERISGWCRRIGAAFNRLEVPAHQMTGSGAVYFGICANRTQARRVAGQLGGLRLDGRRLGWVGLATTL
ncbi:MAG: 4-(cytidine 5'-diphospho)-2-C-methyl-D-erythritol kinase, partial [Planctomycetota bacterium]